MTRSFCCRVQPGEGSPSFRRELGTRRARKIGPVAEPARMYRSMLLVLQDRVRSAGTGRG